MQKKMCCVILALGFILVFAGGALCEMSSENYSIHTSVMSGGGTPMESTRYQTNPTLGQPSPVMNSADPPYSTNYDLYPGFWYTVAAEPVDTCEGDFDNDGDVDGSDLATFAADFGRTDCTGDCEGDFDGDNDVDGSDLAVFAADFGRTDCP